MFFGKRREKKDSVTVSQEHLDAIVAQLQDEYLRFTKSRLRSINERINDLRELVMHQHTAQLAFMRAYVPDEFVKSEHEDCIDWMLIGTTYVTIKHQGHHYGIGEFLVYITRFDSDGFPRPNVLVENVTPHHDRRGGPRASPDSPEFFCGHPHTCGNMSSFCMQAGSLEINHALAEGDILTAFYFIDKALRSYGPGRPFCPLGYWPSVKHGEES